MSQFHSAAILSQHGCPLTIAQRQTPEPGTGELLIEVKAVALNPVDHYQRDFGMPPVPVYPAVIGCDAAGIVVKAGLNVPSTLVEGTRVAGLVSSFYQGGDPNYGAFQKFALVQSECVIPLPNSLTYEQAAMFPLACMTALTAWTTIGIPLDTKYTAKDKQAVLIWGGASSVGTFSIQSARSLGYTVYATASPQHHEVLEKLGAHAMFDYKDAEVVSKIVEASKEDGVVLTTAHCVVNDSLQPSLDVLRQTMGNAHAKVVHSPVLPEDHPTLANTTILFNFPSLNKDLRDKHMQECFHGWLQKGLESGTVVPSPKLQLEDGGLEGLNAALDKLRAGVSGAKIVVSI